MGLDVRDELDSVIANPVTMVKGWTGWRLVLSRCLIALFCLRAQLISSSKLRTPEATSGHHWGRLIAKVSKVFYFLINLIERIQNVTLLSQKGHKSLIATSSCKQFAKNSFLLLCYTNYQYLSILHTSYKIVVIRNCRFYPIYQPLRSGRFLSGVLIQSFPSPRLVASPRLKNLVCPTIYP